MKFSDIKTFKDFLTSFFILEFEPEEKPKPKQKPKPKKKVVYKDLGYYFFPKKSTRRARTKSGTYKGDDPKTKDVNEAWE